MKWEKVKLGDIATCIQPGPFGSQLHNSDYSKEGTPIIMPKDIVGGAIVHSGLLKVSEEHVKRLSRHQVYEGNLIVARKGDVRKCAYITANENGWMTGSDCLKVVLDESKCYPKFIYYQLRSEHIGRWLEKVSIGATMPSLNTGLLSGIEMALPPIEIQKQIAGILSVYDDLIENNQKQIKLLEEAAQRLYKEWFVDLRFPGHENTKIVDGVPEGWSKSMVSEVSAVLRRGISPKYNEKARGIVINQKCIRQTIVSYDEARTQEKKYPAELEMMESDIVICSTGAGTLGRVGQIFEAKGNATLDSHVTLIRANEKIGQQYLFWSLKMQQDYLMSAGKGSTNQLELSRETIGNCKILIPEQKIAEQAEKNFAAIHDKMKECSMRIARLREVRDLLLPKLMSGEVEV